MKTTMKKSVARVITMALVLVMMLSLVVPTMAAELSPAKGLDEAKYGVFKFNMKFDMPAYGDGVGIASRGTAFLINDEYIVTAAHCTKLIEEYVNPYGYTLTEENTKLSLLKSELKYSVTVERDMTVGATLVTSSDNMDFAILKLDQKIPTRKYLTLRDSKDVKTAETVFSVGFPAFYDAQTYDNTYTVEDVTMKSGVISKSQGLAEWKYYDYLPTGQRYVAQNCKGDVLNTTCNISGGDSGGPLVDANGFVVGVSIKETGNGEESFYSAAAIDQIMRACDNLGIEYFTDQTAAPAETQPAVVETQAPATEPVATQPPVTEPPVTQPPVVETQPPVVQKEESGINMTTILIVAAVAVIAVIVVIIIIMSKGKKNKQPAYSAPTGGFTPAAPSYTAPMGAGETTVLGGDAGATTVLSRGGSLIRKRTNETIVINAERFIIGRERKTANYCVADNSSVSRSHVTLITRGGMVFLMDMNAANGTFVNGVKVMPNQEVALKNGDKIKLADEEFEFRA